MWSYQKQDARSPNSQKATTTTFDFLNHHLNIFSQPKNGYTDSDLCDGWSKMYLDINWLWIFNAEVLYYLDSLWNTCNMERVVPPEQCCENLTLLFLLMLNNLKDTLRIQFYIISSYWIQEFTLWTIWWLVPMFHATYLNNLLSNWYIAGIQAWRDSLKGNCVLSLSLLIINNGLEVTCKSKSGNMGDMSKWKLLYIYMPLWSGVNGPSNLSE